MNDQQPDELSEFGIARRNQMLNELKTTIRKNQRRKKLQRAAVACSLAVGLSAVMAWQLLAPDLKDQVAARSQSTFQLAPVVKGPSTDVQPGTRPGAKPNLLEFGLVSNDEILDLLNEVGQPTALAKINNQWVAIPLGTDLLSQ